MTSEKIKTAKDQLPLSECQSFEIWIEMIHNLANVLNKKSVWNDDSYRMHPDIFGSAELAGQRQCLHLRKFF